VIIAMILILVLLVKGMRTFPQETRGEANEESAESSLPPGFPGG